MKFFEYLYYRMYQAYTKKNDSPVLRTFMYVSLIVFFIIMIMLIYLDKILIISNELSEDSSYEFRHSKSFLATIILSVLLFTYFRFTRKGFAYYEERYSKYYSLNKSIKNWMLIAFPVPFFFLGILLIAPLFGGTIFGIEIKGIFGN